MKLPIEVTTVGELREAVKGYYGLLDIWVGDTGGHLNAFGPAYYEVSDTFIEGLTIFTIEDLLKNVEKQRDEMPVRTFVQGKPVKLIAVGPAGEDVDFSFNIEEK